MSFVKVFIERSQVASVRSRVIPNTNNELEYQQKIWIYCSFSKFPTEYSIRLPKGIQSYAEGDYIFDIQTNMKPDKYKGLSFDPFLSTTLIPVTSQFLEAFDKLDAQISQQLVKS